MIRADAKKMEVTAIVATLNSGGTLRRCLDSLMRARPAVFREVLVIDGGSSDDTVQIAQAAGADRVIEQKSKGLYAALNEAVETAKTSHVMFVHSDDWIEATGELPILDESRIPVFNVKFFEATGKRMLYERRHAWFLKSWLRWYPFIFHPNAIYPARLLKEHPYREDRWGSRADMYQIAEIAPCVNFVASPELTYCFRISDSSTTVRTGKRQSIIFWIFRIYLFVFYEDKRLNRILKRMRGSRGAWAVDEVQ